MRQMNDVMLKNWESQIHQHQLMLCQVIDIF